MTLWGARTDLVGLEVHDCARAAQTLGQSSLRDVVINYTTANMAAGGYPVEGGDNLYQYPKAFGFQYYDTVARTVFSNATFQVRHTARGGVTTGAGLPSCSKGVPRCARTKPAHSLPARVQQSGTTLLPACVVASSHSPGSVGP